MPICPTCHTEMPSSNRFCPSCGSAMPPPLGQPTDAYAPPEDSAPSDPASSDVRFPPGTLVAGRYRIVALLGKGGMGEVYRADDLKLGQSVALKFLPAALVGRPDRLERLHSEVRVARQVSHPNVCRVYDVGEADGQTFLTMEFIDGQDLAGLLRQVGRLPEDRGVELARQLCLGLAAAHDRGIIHRDLKPQNVMIDGRGQVRITDFGLAVLAGTAADISSGTPAYMAPEQFAGKDVSAQSDLYSLGLILHEIFTGKKVYAAKTPDELRKLHADSAPSKPSSHVSGLNPAIERAILRCLERDPKDRPRSAYEVLVALPGGDPLAAALAAGETPSPEMVADASPGADFSPRLAMALLAVTLLGLIVLPFLGERTLLINRVPFEDSTEVLRHKTRTILRQLQVDDDKVADSAWGYDVNIDELRYWRANNDTSDRDFLSTGQPAVLYFWYRQSPTRLSQRESPPNPALLVAEPGLVTPARPAHTVPGMATACVDARGRLIELIVVPAFLPSPLHGRGAGGEVAAKWEAAFEAAGLEMRQFKPLQPRRLPPVYADETRAWLGVYPDQPDIPLRVEAAACLGRIVYFHLAPNDQVNAAPRGIEQFRYLPGAEPAIAIVMFAILSLGGWFAWRNVRRGKANLRGAWRLALYYFSVYMLSWLVMAHHSMSFFDELWGLAAPMIGRAAVLAGMLWVIYVALEPYVRQRWPWRMVGWNRLLAGRWRDPVIGRDFLLGAAGAALVAILRGLLFLAPGWMGFGTILPWIGGFEVLANPAFPAAVVLPHLFITMLFFFAIWLIGLVARKDWLTTLLWAALAISLNLSAVAAYRWQPAAWGILLDTFATCIVSAVILFRFGLLAFVCYWSIGVVILVLPLTSNWSAWYASTGIGYLLLLAGLAVGAFVIALDGRSPFGKVWADD